MARPRATRAVLVAPAKALALLPLLAACARSPAPACPPSVSTAASASTNVAHETSTEVFVLGGIHGHHERAKLYTYERLGQIYEQLKPDVLCVEVEQRFLDDGTDHGMPFDFAKFMVPAARKDHLPIVGIDWAAWKSAKMDAWRDLQDKASEDPRLTPESTLFGELFGDLNAYFVERDFVEINAPEIEALWAAKAAFKYAMLERYPEYRPIVEFERARNEHMLANVLEAVRRYPDRRVLVAVGIDHKPYLDRELRARGVHVLDVQDVLAKWGRPSGPRSAVTGR